MPGTTTKSRTDAAAAALAQVEANLAAEPKTEPETKPESKPKPKATKTAKWDKLEKERVAWIRKNARPAVAPCLCGCGGTTKGRFMPGHDATLKATLEAHGDKTTLAAFGW